MAPSIVRGGRQLIAHAPERILPRGVGRLAPSAATHSRFFSNTPNLYAMTHDHQCLKSYQEMGIHFPMAMRQHDVDVTQHAGLFKRTFHTAAVAHEKDPKQHTLVHSSHSALFPAQSLLKRMQGIKREDHVSMRAKGPALTEEQVRTRLAKGELDTAAELSEFFISVSYALTGNLANGESALYYGSRNWSSNKDDSAILKITKKMIEQTLQKGGYSKSQIAEMLPSLMKIAEEYRQLKTSNFIMFIMKEKTLKESVLDCLAYGKLTGRCPKEVSRNPTTFGGSEGGHQARVMVPSLLSPDTDIQMLQLNDKKAVARFVEGSSLPPPEEIALFKGLAGEDSPLEVAEAEKRAELDQRLEVLAGQVLAVRPANSP